MSHRARHQLLALPGIIFLVLFPIILSLWIAFLWAKSEVNNQLRTFAQLALDKSELVIRQADLVSDAAERYQGQVCTPAHQKRMLNIIRGYLYINELIYARDNHFLCSSLIAPVNGYTIAPADYKREPNVSIYYYRDTPFFSGYKMTYMQRGNYVAVINPLFWSEVMSDIFAQEVSKNRRGYTERFIFAVTCINTWGCQQQFARIDKVLILCIAFKRMPVDRRPPPPALYHLFLLPCRMY